MGNELRPIVHPQAGWCRVQLEQLLDRVDHVNGLAATADTNGQTDAAVFIQHVQEFERTPIHCLIELEVDRPDVVWIVGPQQIPGTVCWAAALAPVREGPMEPLVPPDPLYLLVINAPTLKPQAAIDEPPTPAHMAAGQFTDQLAQLLLLNRRNRQGSALGVAVLAGQAASTAGRPGIDPAEPQWLCGGVPGS